MPVLNAPRTQYLEVLIGSCSGEVPRSQPRGFYTCSLYFLHQTNEDLPAVLQTYNAEAAWCNLPGEKMINTPIIIPAAWYVFTMLK